MTNRNINTAKEYEKMVDSIKVCGTNRGPHDYLPIAWSKAEKGEQITMLMCKVCMNRVSMKTLLENFIEVKSLS